MNSTTRSHSSIRVFGRLKLILPTLLAVLFFVVATAHQNAGAAPLEEVIQHLPIEDLLPLETECSCRIFRKGAPLTEGTAVFSHTSEIGRVRLAGKTRTLQHIQRKRVAAGWETEYGVKGTGVVLTTKEVPFRQACAAYYDPPTDGSCFTGSMRTQFDGKAVMAQIIQVCGC